MKKYFLIIIFGLFANIGNATEAYLVKSQLFMDSELVGSPEIIMLPNEKASMSVSDTYDLQFSAIAGEVDDVTLTANIIIGDQIFNPVINLKFNQASEIEKGPLKWKVKIKKTNIDLENPKPVSE